MRSSLRILALLVALGIIWSLAGPVVADKDNAEQVDKLIEQLGSGSFKERESATKALDAIGAPALEKLRKAAQSDDVEVSRRAADLVKRIEKRAEVGRVLTPKRVHLVYKDTPLKDALDDFKKKSGYDIALQDPESKLAERKVTLDTGDITFWEAFDQFCDKAGLAQATPQDMMRQMMEQQQRMMRERQKAVLPPAVVPPPAEVKKEAKEKAAEKKDGRPGEKAAVPAVPPVARLPAAMPAMRMRFGGAPMMAPNQLVLVDSKAKTPPTHYVGAVRVRALRMDDTAGGQEAPLNVNLQVSAEPKLQLRSIVSTRIDKAIDDNDQSLAQQMAGEDDDLPRGVAAAPPIIRGPGGVMRMPMMGGPGGGPGQTAIQFKKGDKPSKTLKELKGTVTVQMLDESQTLMTVDNILKAAGTTIKGKDGGSIKIVEASKTEDGQVKLQVELEQPPDVTPARGPGSGVGFATTTAIRINAAVPIIAPPPPPPVEKPKAAAPDNPKEAPPQAEKGKAKEEVKPKPVAPPAIAAPALVLAPVLLDEVMDMGARYPGNIFNGLMLVDEKGKSFPISRVTASSQVVGPGKIETKYEMTFQATKDQSAPAKLTFAGSRTVTIDIPFTLKDVPLK